MIPSLRQILVHLDPGRASAPRLATARQLAQRFGTELAALYAAAPGLVELPYASEMGPPLASRLAEIDDERRERVRARFDAEMALPGPAASWGHVDDVPITSAFARQALHADLLVLGQHDADDEAARCVPAGFVAGVLLESGRPGLVLPCQGAFPVIGERVAVAWKESAQAARALHAAMPLLQQASRVHLLAWSESPPARVGGDALDLDRYLRAHGVQATWHHEGDAPSDLGARLLSRVADLQADLLVMGCYGHSRAREWMLGGASRTVLRSATVPVLMAH
jgi:nucleotide-binding universal stress UspA family protein